MRHLLVSADGFYFKDRVGEKLAIHCYQQYRSLYYYSDNKKLERLGTMLNHIGINESWASFQNKLNENGPTKQDLENGWNDFKDWLESGNDRKALLYLWHPGGFLFTLAQAMETMQGRQDVWRVGGRYVSEIEELAPKWSLWKGYGGQAWTHKGHFMWSGADMPAAREAAAEQLVLHLNRIAELSRGERIYLVGHSHGCNVSKDGVWLAARVSSL